MLPTIDDGYTLRFRIPASALHPELAGSFRPCLPEERRTYWDWEEWHDKRLAAYWEAQAKGEKWPGKSPEGDKTRRQAELIAAHVQPAEPAAAWAKLHPNAFDRLFNVVMGLAAPMPDGEPTAGQEGEQAKNSPAASG